MPDKNMFVHSPLPKSDYITYSIHLQPLGWLYTLVYRGNAVRQIFPTLSWY